MTEWIRCYVRALLISGSPLLAWRIGRPYLMTILRRTGEWRIVT